MTTKSHHTTIFDYGVLNADNSDELETGKFVFEYTMVDYIVMPYDMEFKAYKNLTGERCLELIQGNGQLQDMVSFNTIDAGMGIGAILINLAGDCSFVDDDQDDDCDYAWGTNLGVVCFKFAESD